MGIPHCVMRKNVVILLLLLVSLLLCGLSSLFARTMNNLLTLLEKLISTITLYGGGGVLYSALAVALNLFLFV